MKTKFKFIMVAGLLSLLLASCTSMYPVSDSSQFPADGSKYTVLGRVELKASASNSGYSMLYQEAKRRYPEADDVVNIKVDRKNVNFLFLFNITTCEYSGIAIKYNK